MEEGRCKREDVRGKREEGRGLRDDVRWKMDDGLNESESKKGRLFSRRTSPQLRLFSPYNEGN
jgi:hypothetical protein